LGERKGTVPSCALYGSAFVKDNLHRCLRGNALHWYSTLSEINRLAIQGDRSPSLYQWIGRLQLQFRSRKPLPEPPPRSTYAPAPTYTPAPSTNAPAPSPSTFSEPTASRSRFTQQLEQIADSLRAAIRQYPQALGGPKPLYSALFGLYSRIEPNV
jgi:hypothetical protein